MVRWHFAECNKFEPLLLERAGRLHHKSHLYGILLPKGSFSQGKDKKLCVTYFPFFFFGQQERGDIICVFELFFQVTS